MSNICGWMPAHDGGQKRFKVRIINGVKRTRLDACGPGSGSFTAATPVRIRLGTPMFSGVYGITAARVSQLCPGNGWGTADGAATDLRGSGLMIGRGVWFAGWV